MKKLFRGAPETHSQTKTREHHKTDPIHSGAIH